MKIGDKVRRKSPEGTWAEFVINTHSELEYHKDMEKHGYTYVVVAPEHGTCVSCEG